MAAADIGEETSDRDIDRMGRAEELDAHDRAGKRRVRRAGENRDEAKCREEVGRCAEQARQGIAESRPDEEKRRDLAAFEAAAQGHDREDDLERPGPIFDMRAVEEPRYRYVVWIW